MRMVMMAAAGMIAALAVASPAQAAHKHSRHHAARYDASTGPLIMSGSLVPYGARHASAPVCKPVTIRVR